MRLKDILARRTDLSTFLVHITRHTGGRTAKERLENIIPSGSITAASPFGHAVKKMVQSGLTTDNQKCVCFTETPLEHVPLLTVPIKGRQVEFQPYGVVISKKQGREYGVNPVWYLDITPGHHWLTNPLDQMVDAAVINGQTDPLFVLTPSINSIEPPVKPKASISPSREACMVPSMLPW